MRTTNQQYINTINNHCKALFLIMAMVFSFLSAAYFAHDTFAASCGGVETIFIECEGGGDAGIYHILALVLDIMSMGVGILGIIGISWAGIEYMTAAGNTNKTMHAKRRIFEIVIGVSLYAVLWTFTSWLLPSKKAVLFADTSEGSDISLSYNGVTQVGITFTPTVTFEKEVENKTYSLISSDKDVVITLGRSAKCISNGTATLKAISAGGKTATMSVTCEGSTIPNNGTTTRHKAIDGTPTMGNMESVRFNGKVHTRTETERAIKNHNRDFYWYNYSSEIKKRGGYNKYVQSLGGVFRQFGSQVDSKGNIKKISVKTAADFQAAAEYVYGLWWIWGPDYGNGSRHVNWKTSDAFYNGQPGRGGKTSYTVKDINSVLRTSAVVRTNCNCAVDTFYKSTTLGSYSFGNKNKYPKMHKWTDLKVGDVIYFYRGGRWVHVAMVGEVYRDYVVIYDGGSRLQKNTNYKFAVPRKSDGVLRGSYKTFGSWFANRPWKINQSVTLRGIN